MLNLVFGKILTQFGKFFVLLGKLCIAVNGQTSKTIWSNWLLANFAFASLLGRCCPPRYLKNDEINNCSNWAVVVAQLVERLLRYQRSAVRIQSLAKFYWSKFLLSTVLKAKLYSKTVYCFKNGLFLQFQLRRFPDCLQKQFYSMTTGLAIVSVESQSANVFCNKSLSWDNIYIFDGKG